MKRIFTAAFCFLALGSAVAQETEVTVEKSTTSTTGEPDTTRINLGKKELIIISQGEVKVITDGEETIVKSKPSVEAHWAGIEFGPTILMNSSFGTSFPGNPQWENDPAKSFSWNFNVLEHKFRIYKNYFGITTGLGLNVTGVGLKKNVLVYEQDSLFSYVDTVNTFNKNKLRVFYLTAPLLLEICTNADGDDDGFYLAAGVIGGVRIGSNVKTKIDTDNRDTKEKHRSTFGLEAFRLDAAVKMGYNHWGAFANYALTPMFDTDKTAAVYPLTVGLTYNF